MLQTEIENPEEFPNYAKLIRSFLKKFPWSICYDPTTDDHRQIISETPLPSEIKNESKDKEV